MQVKQWCDHVLVDEEGFLVSEAALRATLRAIRGPTLANSARRQAARLVACQMNLLDPHVAVDVNLDWSISFTFRLGCEPVCRTTGVYGYARLMRYAKWRLAECFSARRFS